jgi:hypothetical protein
MELEWKPINEPPEQSGYVLIAGSHHNIPMVMEGFCKIHQDGMPTYSENTYSGNGVVITHWMPLPKHPYKK